MNLKSLRKRVVSVFALLYPLFGASALCQSQHASTIDLNLNGQRIDNYENPKLDHKFKHFEVYELGEELSTQNRQQLENGIPIQLILSETLHWELALVPNYLLASDIRIQAATDSGYKTLEKPPCTTFMGSPASGTQSSVRINLSKNSFWGMLPKPGVPGEILYIEPLRNFDTQSAYNRYIVYAPEDVVEMTNTVCAHDHVGHLGQSIPKQGNARSGSSDACFGVEMAVAVDFSAYDYDQESETNVINRYTGALNVADGFYDVFNLDFIIQDFFIVETLGADPWTPTGDAELLLADFASWANSYFTHYDIASLWTYRNIDIDTGNLIAGLATGKPCYQQKAHNLMKVGSYVSSVILSPLWAHEIGHNLNAAHDPPNTPFIMKETGSLYQITEFSAQSQQDINAYINNYSCVSCIAPDLICEPSKKDDGLTLDWGAQYTLTTTVQNIGVLTAGSSVMRYYLSDDDRLDQNDNLLGASNVPTLDRDTEVSIPKTILLPTGNQSQLKYLIYQVDATQVLDERSGEDNNIVAIPLIMTNPNNPIDLQASIDQQSIPSAVVPDTSFQTPVVIDLSGAYDKSLANRTSYGVKLFLSPNETIGATSIEVGAIWVNNTQPLTTQTVLIPTQIPANIDFGKYNLIAQVDVTDEVIESNEFNNLAHARINVTAPDLLMADLHVLFPGPKTSSFHVSGKVKNQGALPAGTSSLGVSVLTAPNGSNTTTEAFIANYPVPALGAEGFHAFSHSFNYVPPANHTIRAVKFVADALNEVDEESEANNEEIYRANGKDGSSFAFTGSEGALMFPNPANDQVALIFEGTDWATREVELLVVNSTGQQMQLLKIPGNTYYAEWDVSDFPAGIYQVILRQNGNLVYRDALLKP